ncbi:MAG: DUF1501 domain-containing protein, partial [Ramlibacter sp.]|nr:DUF1501 domain-containing protein [Ramlibacter sp.]
MTTHMTKHSTLLSRRHLIGGALATLGLAGFSAPSRAAVSDYKAIVCVNLMGGNDGNNLIVPLDDTRYARYTTARGSAGLALSTSAKTLLASRSATTKAVDAPVNQPFAFHYGLPEVDALYAQGK